MRGCAIIFQNTLCERRWTIINDKTHVKHNPDTGIGAPAELACCEEQAADYNRFVEYMNEKAESIGMTSSHFNDAAGMHNISTARDILRLAVCAKQYPILDEIWSRDTHLSQVKGPNARTIESVSKSIHPDLNDHYKVLGRKGGTLRSSAKNLFVHNLVSFLEIPNSKDLLLVVVMNAYGDNNTAENRYHATKQVADIAIATYNDPETTVCDTSVCCENAIAAIVPTGEEKYDKIRILYEKNADVSGLPMSVSKILTAICVLDHVKNLDHTITYHAYDTNIGAYYVKDFFADDEISYEDALHVLMLESSNVTAQALGRSVGKLLNANVNTENPQKA